MRPPDAVPDQLADVPARAATAAARVLRWPRSQLGAGLGGTDAAQRARAVQPTAAVAARHPRGKPAHAHATAQSQVSPEPAVPVPAHAVRAQRPGADDGVGRGDGGGQRAIAREPVQFERLRVEEHHRQPPDGRLDRRGLAGRSAAVQTSTAAAAAAAVAVDAAAAAHVVVVLRQRTLAGLRHPRAAVTVVPQQRQQAAERRRPVRIRPRVSGVAHPDHRYHDDVAHAQHSVAVPVAYAHPAEEGQVRERRGPAASDEGGVLRVQAEAGRNGPYGVRGERLLTPVTRRRAERRFAKAQRRNFSYDFKQIKNKIKCLKINKRVKNILYI